jgi:predicted Zn-ribbon and HTH transcriptional regulator
MTHKRTKIAALACTCERCGHEWTSIGRGLPTVCARCKSRSWDVEPGSVPLGRPPLRTSRSRR